MFDLLWLVPMLPFAGFLVLMFGYARLSRTAVAAVGAGSVGLSAAVAFLIGACFMTAPPKDHAYTLVLWQWLNVDGFQPNIALYLDALSVVMMLVVTGVGFLIHVYATEYMADDSSYARFFACMNLFVAAMLILVLADNLLLLYVGWEGVGLCSYLLIGFWYKDPANCRAAFKAFLVTRVGDTAMALGLFLLVIHFRSLNIQEIMGLAHKSWMPGSGIAVAAAALILGGAIGKSGQAPLQVWLPDAMAGPTPVSALIHAATMVTAGVYLIARTHVLFELAPVVQMAVAIIGAVTLLLAGCAALCQRDIKRVLAYSTISQIGYMFLALGVGGYSAAIFHLTTHAFFKALLFMAAGAIIVALHHEQDMFKMGGLRKELPAVFWTFLIGAMSLAALPLVTAGFYSKDFIMWDAWASEIGGPPFWIAAWLGAGMTSLYTFRMVFLTFFGEAKTHVHVRPGKTMIIPLVILALCATFAGFLETPGTLGGVSIFSEFMETALPAAPLGHSGHSTELMLQFVAEFAVIGGLIAAIYLFLKRRDVSERIARTPKGAAIHALWFQGWGFDWAYDILFVQPFLALTRRSEDVCDLFYNGLADLSASCHGALSRTQNGRLRWYMTGVAIGAVILAAAVVLL